MVLPIPDLPDDVDALKAMISAMAEERAANEARLVAAQAEITRLEAVEKSANERIANVGDYLKEGQVVRVKVIEMDDRGRIRLSIKALLEGEAKVARETADSFGLKTAN